MTFWRSGENGQDDAGAAVRSFQQGLPVVLGTGAVLGVLGPFDTHEAYGFLGSLGYWIIVLFAGWAIVEPAVTVGRRLAGGRALGIAGGVVAASLPLSLGIVLVNTLFADGWEVAWAQIPVVFGGVLVISAAVTAVMLLAESASPRTVSNGGLVSAPVTAAPLPTGPDGQTAPSPDRADTVSDPEPDPAEEPGPSPPAAVPLPPLLRDRVPLEMREAGLLALHAEDHYLRVVTSAGEALVLARLSDAAAALSGADGLQIHRSHWIARAAVESPVREGDRLFLRLTGGDIVKVARGRRPDLKAAGWL